MMGKSQGDCLHACEHNSHQFMELISSRQSNCEHIGKLSRMCCNNVEIMRRSVVFEVSSEVQNQSWAEPEAEH